MKRTGILLIVHLFNICLIHAQDSALINSLLARISAQQIKTKDSFFLPGIFPSYVSKYNWLFDQKKDNNIFYNALISYTLKGISHAVNPDQQAIIAQINSTSKPLYTYFKNRKGRNTYNFWRTDTSFIFPYTNWIHKIRKSVTLPDDLDDTVLSLMALESPDSVAASVHTLMKRYVNSDTNHIKTTLQPYEQIPAYSTWFGKKFPIVFDVCVLSNVLGFVQLYNLPWNKADSASLQLIVATIHNEDHLQNGLLIAPYYAKPSIILYHVARLMSIKKINELEVLKPKLLKDAEEAFQSSNNLLEKMILCSAIMKWGYKPPALSIPANIDIDTAIEQNKLPFFIGNMPSYFPNFYKKILLKMKWGLYYHFCPAYNDALFLEYLLLKRSFNN